jgi:hypothetical protein
MKKAVVNVTHAVILNVDLMWKIIRAPQRCPVFLFLCLGVQFVDLNIQQDGIHLAGVSAQPGLSGGLHGWAQGTLLPNTPFSHMTPTTVNRTSLT